MSRNNANKFPPEVRERAVRLVQESRSEYPSLWVAVESIAPKIGCSAQTLVTWVKRHEVDSGQREGGHHQLARTHQGVRAGEPRAAPRQRQPAHRQRFFRAGGAQPQTEVVNPYIDRHREVYGVEPICKVLQVASSAYRRHAARLRDSARRSDRARRDEQLMPHVQRVWQENHRVYDADKVWRQLNREGVMEASCTIERLMRAQGLQGVRRGKRLRTTIADDAASHPMDRVNRQLRAERPNQLWVSGFSYVSTWQGWLYVAFVIDVYTRRIVGWRVSKSMTTDFVLDALEQTLYARQPGNDGYLTQLVCTPSNVKVGQLCLQINNHSDRGSQYVSIRYSERLAEAGIEPSVGSRGDSYDNALAETINGLYKAELIHRRASWKARESVELATLEWVAWFNHKRQH